MTVVTSPYCLGDSYISAAIHIQTGPARSRTRRGNQASLWLEGSGPADLVTEFLNAATCAGRGPVEGPAQVAPRVLSSHDTATGVCAYAVGGWGLGAGAQRVSLTPTLVVVTRRQEGGHASDGGEVQVRVT